MKSLKNTNQKEIDYQKMFFFDTDDWNDILAAGKINDIELNSVQLERLRKWSLPLSNKYSELVLTGAIEMTGNKLRFKIYTLINFSGYYQRVELRSTICSNCKRRIVVANPFVSDIYFGVPSKKDLQKIMNKAHRFVTHKNCPLCKSSTINQSAIWAKPSLI